jgi:hypothetical protein
LAAEIQTIFMIKKPSFCVCLLFVFQFFFD